MDSKPTELWTVPRQEVEPPKPAADAQLDAVTSPEPDQPEPKTLIHWVHPRGHRMGRRVLRIEFDGRRLTLIGIRGWGNRRRIDRLCVTDWPEPPSSKMLVKHLRSIIPRGNPIVRLVVNSSRGMVRRFLIPRVPKHKRYAAALWGGKPLVPFPLDNDHAYFGMEFTSADERGCWVTLVALPREDASAIIEAISGLGWPLGGLFLAGTQSIGGAKEKRDNKQTAAEAVVFYSPRRNSFGVFENNRLIFHYDLGPLPGYSSDPTNVVLSDKERSSGSWITGISAAINDAVDFYISAHQGNAPTRLILVGMRKTIAPVVHYVNEWEERFADGVTVQDPVGKLADGLPSEISGWIESNMGLLTHASMATSNTAAIDLTPPHIHKLQGRRRLVKYARTAFVLSVAGTIVSTGLLAKQLQTTGRAVELAREESRILKNSPAVVEVATSIGELARQRAFLAEIQKPPVKWMPWIKTVLGTLPDNGRLTAFAIAIDGDNPLGTSLLVHLDGTLAPTGFPHAINYKEWIARLELLTGQGRVKLARESTTTWKGRQRSNFMIELRPAIETVTGRGR